ncbi:MAG TPA: biotin/lipoyl-containing protein [Solirubrobacteraceae bacterium]|nr:biotin/lipoyl-containing protein [Solirubrobacteraceae bacterium]
MEAEVMKALLEAFEQSDWQEMTVTIGGDHLYVSRRPDASAEALPHPSVAGGSLPGSAPAVSEPSPPSTAVPEGGNGASARESEPAPATGSAPARTGSAPTVTGQVADGVEITAPSVGLFWRAPAPGAAPFVQVGSRVATGDTLAIVEVMKLMNHITAPSDGRVDAILAENGAAVEFGQTLIVIDPEG